MACMFLVNRLIQPRYCLAALHPWLIAIFFVALLFAGAAGIRDAQGAWGVLSGNLVTRQESFRLAVVTAFAPFFNPKIYQGAAVAGA